MVINEIIRKKLADKVHPAHATLKEITALYEGDDLSKELDRLLSQEKITTGNTINGTYFKPKNYE